MFVKILKVDKFCKFVPMELKTTLGEDFTTNKNLLYFKNGNIYCQDICIPITVMATCVSYILLQVDHQTEH